MDEKKDLIDTFWDFRSCRSCKQQELELQQLSGIRNDGNQDAQPVVDKDK